MSVVFLGKWFGHRTGAQASVVLRRQVPIRFDEPPRSWFGGLPRMPDNIPWPRVAKGAPLHFIAQIACADLPKQIWHGRGPRDGWLLLFVEVLQLEDDSEGLLSLLAEAWQGEDESERRLIRVLHIDRLGPERQPPDDMPTVRHALADHIGQFEPEIRDGVPKLWRRWPVDLVVQQVPAPPTGDGETKWEPAEVTGAELYGAPEDEENIDRFAEAEPRPLTWRGALYLVEELMRVFSKNLAARAKVWEPGWLARAIAKMEASVLHHAAGVAEATTKLQCWPEAPPTEWANLEHYLSYQRVLHSEAEQTLADLAGLSQQMTEDALAAEIARAGGAHMSWVDMQKSELERMRRHILTQDLDALMGDESWAAMKAKLIAAESEYWMWDDSPTYLRKIRTTLFDYADYGLRFALREDLLDLYTRSAAAQASIPQALRAELEPKLRNIYRATTPHRMGGPRDLLQNWADPDDDDLLFQIGSDYAMGWMWGDLGALFVYVSPSYLKVRWFKRAHAWIDGH
jgi:uncharacterized protein YwqG